MRRILLLKQMKKANHLMPRILDMDNLRMAFWKASKGKRYAASVREYQNNLQQNLLNLRDQIESVQYFVLPLRLRNPKSDIRN